MDNYLNKDICFKCQGKCCKSMPGTCSPEDIMKLFPSNNLEESIKKALETKNYAIDWWEGKKPLYYIRPATKKAIGKVYDSSWGGECVFLTEKGCKLSDENRPLQCKQLKPAVDMHCGNTNNTNKHEMALMWKQINVDLSKYQHMKGGD